MSDGADDDFKKEIELKADESEVDFTITQDDIRYIRNTVPFSPQLTFTVPAGDDIVLSNTASLEATITVSAVTNVDQTFELNGGN